MPQIPSTNLNTGDYEPVLLKCHYLLRANLNLKYPHKIKMKKLTIIVGSAS